MRLPRLPSRPARVTLQLRLTTVKVRHAETTAKARVLVLVSARARSRSGTRDMRTRRSKIRGQDSKSSLQMQRESQEGLRSPQLPSLIVHWYVIMVGTRATARSSDSCTRIRSAFCHCRPIILSRKRPPRPLGIRRSRGHLGKPSCWPILQQPAALPLARVSAVEDLLRT